MLDLLNLVDVGENKEQDTMQQITLGCIKQGIDLLYIEDMNILMIVVWYQKLLVQDAIEKLCIIVIVAPVRQARALTDDEIESIISCASNM